MDVTGDHDGNNESTGSALSNMAAEHPVFRTV